jgi:hypothetical protein
LVSLKKSDYPVYHSGTSDFGRFRAKPRKKLNLKIQEVLRHGKNTKRDQGAKIEEI